jgi:methylmalonyl-CoA/ethylmalonyl-CoA epimerase
VNLRGIHHVGVAVSDLDDAISSYQRLFGAEVELRDSLAEQGVEAASLRIGSGRVELLAATGGDFPIARFLAKRGPGMHHVALETDDVGEVLRELEEAGAQLVDTAPRRGLHGLEVAFVHPDSLHGVLTEVVSVGS